MNLRSDAFWLWWPTSGIMVLTAAFLWFIAPLGLGFRFSAADSFFRQVADGIFRFSYFILNPLMVLIWLGLPFAHVRGWSPIAWRLLAFVAALLAGCIAALFALV